jgi:quinol monooxygenase YgiN
MVKVGLIVRLEAKAGKEDELSTFLRRALPLVEQEPQTVLWLGLRAGPSSFAIVDAFPGEEGRQAHLAGAVSAALTERAGDLLARPPEMERVDVLAAEIETGGQE